MADVVFGRVPKPTMTENHLPFSNPMIGYSAQVNIIEAVVWHRMIGTLWGTDGWFTAGHAATAYGVGVISIDGQDDAGRIIEWIDPANGHFYGESSGPVNQPYGDGLLYWQRFGTPRVNPQSVAIEISGNYDTPLDDPARDAIAALTAYYADQRKIPWNEWPVVPGQARSFVIWHQEITIGTGKVCPGEIVMGETPALIERTRAILKKYQEATTPKPVYAEKKPLPNPGVTQRYGGKQFARYVGSLTLAKDASPLQYATPTATPTAKPYAKGRKVSLVNTTIGDDGELWFVERNGNRWPFEVFVEAA